MALYYLLVSPGRGAGEEIGYMLYHRTLQLRLLAMSR